MARAGSAKGETHVVEWQESWRDDYLRWLCGFANADDGRAVTSESWLPIQLVVGRKTAIQSPMVELWRKRSSHHCLSRRASVPTIQSKSANSLDAGVSR